MPNLTLTFRPFEFDPDFPKHFDENRRQKSVLLSRLIHTARESDRLAAARDLAAANGYGTREAPVVKYDEDKGTVLVTFPLAVDTPPPAQPMRPRPKADEKPQRPSLQHLDQKTANVILNSPALSQFEKRKVISLMLPADVIDEKIEWNANYAQRSDSSVRAGAKPKLKGTGEVMAEMRRAEEQKRLKYSTPELITVACYSFALGCAAVSLLWAIYA